MKTPVVASLLALLCVAPTVSAQTDPVEDHLRRGVDLRRMGREAEARAEFEAAYAQRREPRTAAQPMMNRRRGSGPTSPSDQPHWTR